MNIFLKTFKFLLSTLINIVVISGIIIVLAWAVWDVSPQTSITKTAYFFSESWRIISGKMPRTPATPVKEEHLDEAKKNILYLGK